MTQPRDFAKYDDLKPGDCVEVDDGFDCIDPGAIRYINYMEGNGLYMYCRHGMHFLSAQVNDSTGTVIGCYKVKD